MQKEKIYVVGVILFICTYTPCVICFHSPESVGTEEVETKDNNEVETSSCKQHHSKRSLEKSTQTREFAETNRTQVPNSADIYQMQMVLTMLLAREQRRLEHRLSRAQAMESPTKVTIL